jgi:hypothetical protein
MRRPYVAVRSDLYNQIFHSKWFFLAAGTFLLFSAWRDLMKGSTVSPYPHNCRTVTRSDNPYQYWFSIFLSAAFGTFCLGLAVTGWRS